MKFLIDRCAGRRVAAALRDHGHDVVEARDLGPDPGDRTLLKQAMTDGCVLVTIDTDFGRLVHVDRAPHAGVVRLPDVPAARRVALMDDVLRRHARDLDAGALVTVRGGRVRVSKP